jgi:hypothetical protein
MRTAAFNVFDYLRDRFLRVQQKQTMNMVGHAVDYPNRTTHLTQLLPDKIMNFIFKMGLYQWQPVFGGPNGVNPDFII